MRGVLVSCATCIRWGVVFVCPGFFQLNANDLLLSVMIFLGADRSLVSQLCC